MINLHFIKMIQYSKSRYDVCNQILCIVYFSTIKCILTRFIFAGKINSEFRDGRKSELPFSCIMKLFSLSKVVQ